MKDMTVIFIVLLVLLILISTLGGTLYVRESFEDAEKQREQFWEEQAAEQPPVAPLPTADAEADAEQKPEEDVPVMPPAPPAQQPDEPIVEGFDGDMYATVSF